MIVKNIKENPWTVMIDYALKSYNILKRKIDKKITLLSISRRIEAMQLTVFLNRKNTPETSLCRRVSDFQEQLSANTMIKCK